VCVFVVSFHSAWAVLNSWEKASKAGADLGRKYRDGIMYNVVGGKSIVGNGESNDVHLARVMAESVY